jgi:hypothetical protein
MSELKKALLGLLVDGACITAMVMQVQHPGTSWDFWGGVGYFFQAAFILLGLILCMLFLIAANMVSDLPFPRTDKEEVVIKALSAISAGSKIYNQWVTIKELTYCAIFAGMGWWWLATGNFAALLLLRLVQAKISQLQTA